MAVAMMVDNPEGSQETYDRVRERLGLDRPAGGIFHVAGPSPNGGWRVIEVWESEEDAKRFVANACCPPSRRSAPPPAAAAALAGAQPHDVGEVTMNHRTGSSSQMSTIPTRCDVEAAPDVRSQPFPSAMSCTTVGEVMSGRRVLIVGGGIAGLALAPMLARARRLASR